VSTVLAVVLLAFAGFCFGGAYSLHSQKKPLWMVGLVVLLGALSLAAGWLYL
jgi:hypothetical protein